jgi:hypothetical protein
MLLKLKIITINPKILKIKLYYIIRFCSIFKLKYKKKQIILFKKKIALLRSPHIHKKTWQNYMYKFNQASIQILMNKKKFIKLCILLKIISANSIIKFKLK